MVPVSTAGVRDYPVTVDDIYPPELRRSVDLLLQRERTRARVIAQNGAEEGFVCALSDKLIDRGHAATTPTLIGRDQLTDALHTWQQPHPRLPIVVTTIADVVLIGYLAVQAACAHAGLPVPAIGDLDAQRCEREPRRWRRPRHWRLDLYRPDATSYLNYRRPGTPELPLAATAWVNKQATASVVVLSQRDVAKAGLAYLDHALAIVQQDERKREPDGAP